MENWRVTHADKATIINAVRTYAELKHGLIRSFLDIGTEGPRAFNSLRWISRRGQPNWPLEGIQSAPTTGSRKQRRSQAVMVEPPMLCFLEDMIEDFFRLNNANWRRLLGCWLVGQGCLRYRRLSLSTPVKLTVLTLHAHCARGKQAHNRAGFDWSVPVKVASGFCWGEHWLREYQQLTTYSFR